MAENNLVTQSTLSEVEEGLGILATGLTYHAESSLSKAHGLNVLWFSGPTDDAQGNDVQYYRDSYGAILGTHQLRFCVGDAFYFAPGTVTLLDGQPEGSVTTLQPEDIEALVAAQKSTGLVTSFATEITSAIESIRTGLLLPHTQKAHENAHGTLTAFPKNTFSSTGALVGRYVILFQFDGLKYEIPCDPRLGGPPQVPTLASGQPTVTFSAGNPRKGKFIFQNPTIYLHSKPGGGGPQAFSVQYVLAQGSHPISYVWQHSLDQVTWHDFEKDEDTTGTGAVQAKLRLTIDNPGTMDSSGTHIGAFGITNPGSDRKSKWYIRCIFSNSSGTLICPTLIVDLEDDKPTVLCTLAYRQGYLCRTLFESEVAYGQKVHPYILDGYHLWAQPFASWLHKHPFIFRFLVVPLIRRWAIRVGYLTHQSERNSWVGALLLWVGTPICYSLGFLRHQLGAKNRHRHADRVR